MPKQASNIRWLTLQEVARDLRYLLNRGYHKETSLNFLANRWQLSSLEREVLTRAVFSHKEARKRKQRKLLIKEIQGCFLAVDGHNILITVESALRNLPVFICDDGFVRDASRLSRKFRYSDSSQQALACIIQGLKRLPLKGGVVYFDAPLSRSGELAVLARQYLREAGLAFECEVVKSADQELKNCPIIASSDTVLIESVQGAFDLAAYVILKVFKQKPKRL